ncbi:hypothetical protein ACFQ4N_09315 [Oceanobacillus iheyensis]|uniref:hypothetical protein n=1 Tax=Oceanobacillus iheyensis TaxID=182710 RepID=UPI00362DBDC9
MNSLKSSIVYINGIDTVEKDIRPKSRAAVPSPEQDIETIEIKGRHGSLTKKHGFRDIVYQLEFYINDNVSFKRAFRKAKVFLFQARTLGFSDDIEVFYRVKSIQIQTAENIIEKYGMFTVNFALAPFQFENNSIQTITDRTVIDNDGYQSEPYIKAYVSGTGKIIINDQEVTIQNVSEYIEIDSELMNAYRLDNNFIVNMNNHMIGDFPVLKHGDNIIEFSGDITALEIDTRFKWV